MTLTINLYCLVIGADAVGKSTLISKLCEGKTYVEFIHEPLTKEFEQQNEVSQQQFIIYRINLREKQLQQGEALLDMYEMQHNQLVMIVYDLLDQKSFITISTAFKQVEHELRDLMQKAYESEQAPKQTFMEDETSEQFIEKVVMVKKKRMLVLLGNKCDYEYESEREVKEKQIDGFVDQYASLGMVQSEVSALQLTGLSSVKRAIQFYSQKFMTEQDLQNIVKINELIADRDKGTIKQPSEGAPAKKGPKTFKPPKFNEIKKKSTIQQQQSSSPEPIENIVATQQQAKVQEAPHQKEELFLNNRDTQHQHVMESQQKDSIKSKFANVSLPHHQMQQNQQQQQEQYEQQQQLWHNRQSEVQQEQQIQHSQHEQMNFDKSQKQNFNQSHHLQQSSHNQHQDQQPKHSQHEPMKIDQSQKQNFNQSQHLQQSSHNEHQDQQPKHQQHEQMNFDKSQKHFNQSKHLQQSSHYEHQDQQPKHQQHEQMNFDKSQKHFNQSQHLQSSFHQEHQEQQLRHSQHEQMIYDQSQKQHFNQSQHLQQSSHNQHQEQQQIHSQHEPMKIDQSQKHFNQTQYLQQGFHQSQSLIYQKSQQQDHRQPDQIDYHQSSESFQLKPAVHHQISQHQPQHFQQQNLPSKSQKVFHQQSDNSGVSSNNSDMPPPMHTAPPMHSAPPQKKTMGSTFQIQQQTPPTSYVNSYQFKNKFNNVEEMEQTSSLIVSQQQVNSSLISEQKLTRSSKSLIEAQKSHRIVPFMRDIHNDLALSQATQNSQDERSSKKESQLMNKKTFDLKASQMLNKKSDMFDLVEQLKGRQYEMDEAEEVESIVEPLPTYQDDYDKVQELIGGRSEFSFHESSKLEGQAQYELQSSQYDQQSEEEKQVAIEEPYDHSVSGPKMLYQIEIGARPYNQIQHQNDNNNNENIQEQSEGDRQDDLSGSQYSQKQLHQNSEVQDYYQLQQQHQQVESEQEEEQVSSRRNIQQKVSKQSIEMNMDMELIKETVDRMEKMEMVGVMEKHGTSIPVLYTKLPIDRVSKQIRQMPEVEINFEEKKKRFEKVESLIRRNNKEEFQQRIVAQQQVLGRPLMCLQLNLSYRSVVIQIQNEDNAYSLAHQMLRKLNVQTSSHIIQKLAIIIQRHVEEYCYQVEEWIRLKQMGRIEGAKWKAFVYRHPDLLQKIEDGLEPDFNLAYLRELVEGEQSSQLQSKRVSIPRDLIGVLNVELDGSGGRVGKLEIFREDNPAESVKQFMKEQGIHNEGVYRKLVWEVQHLQREWERVELEKEKSLGLSSRNKSQPQIQRSPMPNRLILLESERKVNEVQMMFQIGRERKARLLIRRGEQVKKAVERFAIMHKLSKESQVELLNIVQNKLKL